MNKEDQNISFIDADAEYSSPQGATIKDIVFAHLGKLSTICTKEFKEGYKEKKPVATGGGVYMSEVHHEDTRASYINAVDFLHDLIFPRFNADEKTKIEQIETGYKPEEAKVDKLDYKLENRRKIFRQLSLVLKRLNYLEAESII